MEEWDTFLSTLEKKMGKDPVSKWLRRLKIVQFDACNLYLEPENSFQIEWFKEHVPKEAVKNFRNGNGSPIKIHFTTTRKKKREKSPYPLPTPIEIHSDPIDPSYTFANFLFDQENALLVEFLKEWHRGGCNPVFLSGNPGFGKTHLLMAVANKLKKEGLSVFFVHAETFTSHVVSAIRNFHMRHFRQVYRNQEVLIIDDVHLLSGRSATQEEFFHTFNTLHTAGKQILLSSPLAPRKIEGIEPRLTSRFEWGIALQLKPLAKEKMGEMIANRARLFHFPFSHALAQFLIETFPTSAKSTMQALEALMIRHKGETLLNLHEAENLLKDLIKEEQKLQITPQKIVAATATYFGLCDKDLLGKSQSKEATFPRKLSMFLLREILALSYPAIGKIFKKDHSTVLKGIKQIKEKSSPEEIEAALEEIRELLKQPIKS